MKRRARILIVSIAVVLVGAGVAAWLARDLPRAFVERKLAEALGADVRLGRLVVEGTREFVLEDLTVTNMVSQPMLERLDVPRLEVQGSTGRIAEGHFELLRFFDPELVLGPAGDSPPEGTESDDVTVDRLEVRGGRIVVAASGAIASVEGFSLTLRVGDNARQVNLSAEARSASISIDGRSMELPAPSLELIAHLPDNGDPVTFETTLRLPHAGPVSATGRIDPATAHVDRLDAQVSDVDLAAWLPLAGDLADRIEIEGQGDLRIVTEDGSTLSWELEGEIQRFAMPDLPVVRDAHIQAEGALSLDDPLLGGPVELRIDVRQADGEIAGRKIPEGVLPLNLTFEGEVAGGDAPGADGRVTIRTSALGSVGVEGSLAAGSDDLRGDLQWSWSGSELESLAGIAASAGFALPGDIRLAGRAKLQGTLEGSLAAPSAKAILVLDDLEVEGDAAPDRTWRLRVPHVEAHAVRSGDSTVGVTIPECPAELAVEPLGDVPLTVSGEAFLDPDSQTLRIDRLEIDADVLGRIALEVPAVASGRPVEAKVKLAGVGLADWHELLRPWLGDALREHGIQGNGSADLAVRIVGDGAWSTEGTANIEDSGFASDDGARVAQGFDTAWKIEASGDPAGAARAKARVRAGGFQLLWGSFYADYSDLSADIVLGGTYEPGEASRAGTTSPAWSAHASIELSDGPRLVTTVASKDEGVLAYSAVLHVADLETTLERYLRRPLEGSVPALERLRAEGVVHVDLSGEISETAYSASGNLRLEGVHVGGVEERVQVDRLELELPIDLVVSDTRTGTVEISGTELHGNLGFDHLSLGGVEFERTSMGLLVKGDTVWLEEGLAVPFLGGVLGFEALTLAEALRPSWHLRTAILLHQVSLGELSEALGLFPLEGEMEGYFPDVRLTHRTLRMEGDGEFSLFGGVLRVSDISGEDLLSRYPQLTFSAEFHDIDLLQLTRTFDVGEMTGILQGYLRNCELFRGSPVRFDGRIETVHRPGVPRNLNVKAINNISLLGTGSKVNVLDRGIQKLFNNYTYERLGIDLQLDNDRFLLTGLEQRGGRELFLKGRLPLRIDVVNALPGQTVSFKTMMERGRKMEFSIGSPQ